MQAHRSALRVAVALSAVATVCLLGAATFSRSSSLSSTELLGVDTQGSYLMVPVDGKSQAYVVTQRGLVPVKLMGGGDMPIPIDDNNPWPMVPGSNPNMFGGFGEVASPRDNPCARYGPRASLACDQRSGRCGCVASPASQYASGPQGRMNSRLMGELPMPIDDDGDRDHIVPGSNVHMYGNMIPTTIPWDTDDLSPYVVPNLDDPNY